MRFRFVRHTVPAGRARLLWAFLSVMGCLAAVAFLSRYLADSCYGYALETDFVFGSPSAEAAKSSSGNIE